MPRGEVRGLCIFSGDIFFQRLKHGTAFDFNSYVAAVEELSIVKLRRSGEAFLLCLVRGGTELRCRPNIDRSEKGDEQRDRKNRK